MKAQSIITAGAVLTAGLLLASRADAAVSFSLSDTNGAPNSVTVAPGDSFSVQLQLTSTTELLLGLSYNLEAFGLASSQFRITDRSIGTSPFSDLTTTNAIALQASSALLDPINNADLGGTLADVFSPVGPGSFLVANYTIQALPTIAPDNTYNIGTAAGIATDDAFAGVAVTNATYSVSVIPEPGTAIFGLCVLGAFGARRRRAK
ncbi:MAG: hypothetical protein WCF18_14695 [Chthoniobacteraceae bacterium]